MTQTEKHARCAMLLPFSFRGSNQRTASTGATSLIRSYEGNTEMFSAGLLLSMPYLRKTCFLCSQCRYRVVSTPSSLRISVRIGQPVMIGDWRGGCFRLLFRATVIRQRAQTRKSSGQEGLFSKQHYQTQPAKRCCFYFLQYPRCSPRQAYAYMLK